MGRSGSSKVVKVVIERRDGPDDSPRRESFEVELVPAMTVSSCLQAIERNPVTADGNVVAPVAWDCACLEELCGACTLLVNGVVCQACSARVEQLKQPIELRPLSKFPVIRDLCVDRSVLFETLARAKIWLDRDGASNSAGATDSAAARLLGTCTTCGACAEACPSYPPRGASAAVAAFAGPQLASQVRRLGLLDGGGSAHRERLAALKSWGDIAACGHAQNCVEVCPQEIPLTEVLASLNRDIVKSALMRWLRR